MIKWNDNQKKIIELRDKDILVSAAAGSGKTTVMVERILSMITDPVNPVDIGRIVVVTFTKDAAHSMKNKIYNSIQKRIEDGDDNEHLAEILPLVHNCYIKTIDAFCLDILKEHCMEAGQEPGFTIAENGEIKIVTDSIIDEMMEEYYDKANPKYASFVNVMNKLTKKKDDSEFKEKMLDIYYKSNSEPWPKEWLNSLKDRYEKLYYEDYMQALMKEMICFAGEIKESVLAAERMILDYGADSGIMKDKSSSNYITKLKDFVRFYKDFFLIAESGDANRFIAMPMNYPSFQGNKAKLPEYAELKNMFADMAKYIKEYQKIFLDITNEKIEDEIKDCREMIETLVDFTIDFHDRIQAYKKKKNILEFHDIEHLVLNLLVKKEGENKEYTKLADEYSEYFQEIFIDEYQDSNNLQEEILTSISKSVRGKRHNMFMVGDVKQSIYAFRSAKPDLFLKKYYEYPHYKGGDIPEGDSIVIELNINYRSREHILADVNSIFKTTMKYRFGEVDYTDDVKLNPNKDASYPTEYAKSEIILFEGNSDKSDSNDEDEYVDDENESKVIAKRIRKLIDDEEKVIYDKKNNVMRKAEYSDIVILYRNGNEFIDISNALNDYGIPNMVEDKSNYFYKPEISCVISFLTVIDNVYNDIELYGIMTSYYGMLSANDVAAIKGVDTGKKLYDCILQYIEENPEDEISIKLMDLLQLLIEYSDLKKYISVNELVWRCIYETGYYDHMANYTDCDDRRKNLDALIERSRSYENTSFSGISGFLKYIEKCRKYSVSIEISKTASFNAVRIMTIHKSKGLEFPVVILANSSVGYRTKDITNCELLIDDKFGIASKVIGKRSYRESFLKKVLKIVKLNALCGEEQRLLYVALTRAMDMLIITIDMNNIKEKKSPYNRYTSYLDMFNYSGFLDSHIVNIDLSDVKEKTLDVTALNHEKKEYGYPMAHDMDIRRKMTVSDIKRMSMDEFIDVEGYVPKKVRSDDKGGAEFGTIYHDAMCYVDPSRLESAAEIKEQLLGFGKEFEMIDPELISEFYRSEIGGRVKNAFKQGKLYRERQYYMGIPAGEIYKDYEGDELVVVQGVIDLYFEEEDGLVLIDYKTDRTDNERLIKLYHEQLDQYKNALERLTGKKVKEVYIYSVRNKSFLPLQ